MGKLQIERMVLGMLHTNSWFAINKETKEVIFFDPTGQAEKIYHKVEEMGLKPAAILLTHGHLDHIGAVDAVKKKYGISCYVSEEEKELLKNPQQNCSAIYGNGYTAGADFFLKDKQQLQLAGFAIEAIYTPGHTKGGICYYFKEEGVLFSGDTLFRESIGRTDLPTGSTSALVRSVRDLLNNLPKETKVYPGHGDTTTLAHEKKYNPFI